MWVSTGSHRELSSPIPAPICNYGTNEAGADMAYSPGEPGWNRRQGVSFIFLNDIEASDASLRSRFLEDTTSANLKPCPCVKLKDAPLCPAGSEVRTGRAGAPDAPACPPGVEVGHHQKSACLHITSVTTGQNRVKATGLAQSSKFNMAFPFKGHFLWALL